MQYCCLAMEGAIQDFSAGIKYESYTRSYHVEAVDFSDEETGKVEVGIASLIRFCPWCGKQLPKDLLDEWIEEVKEKFDVKNTLDKQELKKLPKEYMTDEWWVKKGL